MNKSRLDDLHDRRYLLFSLMRSIGKAILLVVVGGNISSFPVQSKQSSSSASRDHPKSAHHFWNVHLDAKPIINKQQSGRIHIIIKNTLSFTFRPSTNNRNRHTLHKKLATVGLHLTLKPGNMNRSDTGTRHILAKNPAQTTV